jgi:phage/plasmid-like protein (TIGR03299 family)
MAHQIETHNGKAAFVTANIPAWHQLGTVLGGAFTAEQAMELGRLGGWNVRKSPLFVAETGQPAEGAYATIRDNPFEIGQVDVLGVVGETYHPVQNEELADILDALVDESGAVFDTAGSLRGGAQTFVTMKLPGHMLIGGVDAHEMHVAAVNSHDGNGSLTLLVTPVRIVCANTLSAALGSACVQVVS